MNRKGQSGNAMIWGGGALLMAFGLVLVLEAHTQQVLGNGNLAFLESFMAIVLLMFAIISFFVANK